LIAIPIAILLGALIIAGGIILNGRNNQTANTAASPTLQTIPSVVGMTENEARNILEENAMSLNVEEREFNEQFPEGQIISQSPLGGTETSGTTIVAVHVSKGASPPDNDGKPEIIDQGEADKKAVLGTIDNWTNAWQKLDLDAYMSNYSRSASIYSNNRSYSYDQFYEHERNLFSSGGDISVTHGAPTFTGIDSNRITVSMSQTFQRWGGKGNYRSSGRQTFQMVKENGRWLIASETFVK
jgi:hypothetical protein